MNLFPCRGACGNHCHDRPPYVLVVSGSASVKKDTVGHAMMWEVLAEEALADEAPAQVLEF